MSENRVAAPLETDSRVAVAIYGPLSLHVVGQILKVMSDTYPGAMAYDGEHAETRRLRATLCVAIPWEVKD